MLLLVLAIAMNIGLPKVVPDKGSEAKHIIK